MNKVGKLIDQRLVAKVIKQKNIDPSKLPTVEELNKRTVDMAQRSVESNRQRYYYRMSVWSGNVPLRFKFSDWQVDAQRNQVKAKQLGNQAFVLAKEMITKPFNVAMVGDRGVGKTALALAMMSQLMQCGKTAMFVSTAELLRLVNDRYSANDVQERLMYIAKDMKSVDVLVLDDFGTEGGKPTESGYYKPVHKDLQTLMYQVANARVDFEHNRARYSTIITTNNSRDQLRDMYDKKTIDRLFTKNSEHRLVFDGMKGVRNV
ncbi:ATP-binding protein [Lactiplantibacillus plajomi]|uniref:ATP-binding protein n=1 Tax=Lactiplantibacillus plajomi TaxID=1457217 RepID=A0ABV6K0T9_9LACO|nr:ATP-binding protein [Lactiplantibacillus plajomi]